jgi:hypothetical protein
MKHPMRVVLILLMIAVFLRPGNGCAFPDEEDVFQQHSDPDGPYGKFLAGRLGLLKGSYRIRHLVAAYNVLSGRGLSEDEQKAAVDVDKYYNSADFDGSAYDNTPAATDASGGRGQWSEANVERKVPGQDWESFANCLSDAFRNANATLADRRARYGKPGQADSPEIADWIAGQDAVFSNCAGEARMPNPAPVNAPLWLRQDRAYQLAAASFYGQDYEGAAAAFKAIAADKASPWAPLARYLVARACIRKALVPYAPFAQPSTPEKAAAQEAQVREWLGKAREQLQGILKDPAMKPLHRQSRRLLDFVMLRVDPTAQADELARRLTAPRKGGAGDPDYFQNVIDLTVIYNSLPPYSPWIQRAEAKAQAGKNPPAPLIAWLDALGWSRPRVVLRDGDEPMTQIAADRKAEGLALWRAGQGAPGLVAALAAAEPGDAANEELIKSARAVPASSPAWPSVTFERLRLAAAKEGKQVYAELSKLLPEVEKSQPVSTVNAFADLHSGLSPSLEEYLKNATRLPASWGDADGGEGEPLPGTTGNSMARTVTLCNVDVYAPTTRHLDEETALVFGQRLPLKLLKQAALSPALPGNVRFEVAHTAWTRALLLDDFETARALTPYLAGCQPAFKNWLEQLDTAKTQDERHVPGLLALMRFTSTNPSVFPGVERDFASYSAMRENWWCKANRPVNGDPSKPQPMLFTQAIVERSQQPDPPFLTDADRAEVTAEIAKLKEIPCASDYFARQTLDWVKVHPEDKHNSELLGFAMRVVRNACRSDATAELNHQLFDTLHRRYPKSEWAQKYTTWE